MAKGFNRPAGGGGMGGNNMMSQIRRMQEQMEAAQAQLAEEIVEASVGGGALKVTMTGDQHCRSVVIDPELLKDADVDMLQDLFLSAVNMALDKSRALASERLGPLAGGLM
jgi:DNA-binding YbaB/EbfC family protein